MGALLKWWFVLWACVVGALFVQANGLFTALWYADHIKISFVILGIFALTTIYVGVLTYRLKKLKSKALDAIEQHLPSCWLSTETMNALGMIGTVAGFLIMLAGAFGQPIDPANTEAMKKLIAAAALGLSTSACATLVGLICATIAKWQVHILEKECDQVRAQAQSQPQETLHEAERRSEV